MPLVARKFILYPEGSAEAMIQAAITERYGGNNEGFFRDVAEKLAIRPDSAGGEFYRAMRRQGTLPETHRAAYEELLGLPSEVVSAIGRDVIVRDPADPLAKLRGEVADLTEALEVARRAYARLEKRVSDLERGTGGGRSRRPAGAKP